MSPQTLLLGLFKQNHELYTIAYKALSKKHLNSDSFMKKFNTNTPQQINQSSSLPLTTTPKKTLLIPMNQSVPQPNTPFQSRCKDLSKEIEELLVDHYGNKY